MKNIFNKLIFLLLFPVLVISCTKKPLEPEQAKYLKVAETTTSGSSFTVGYFAKDSLFVGYNKTYFKITDKSTGLPVEQATLVLNPMMDMGTMKHSCPSENPGTSLNSDGYFEGAVIFSMAGNTGWSVGLTVTANGKTETANFPLENVKATVPVKKIVIIDSLSTGQGTWTITKYPVSLIEPGAWKVGTNQFEITIHTMASMMSFPCCADLAVEITPEMPSMGHGSPNNVNPVSTGMGHYVGTVNFTMTGAWRVNMVFKKGDRTISGKGYFDIVF